MGGIIGGAARRTRRFRTCASARSVIGALPTIRASPQQGSAPMQVDPSIFKAYDIRGIVGQHASTRPLPSTWAAPSAPRRVAAGERAVAVGRDGRLSGPALAAALIRGLASTGLDVVDLGAVTTPMLYYVAATRGDARLPQRHPGHRQPQPEGLQRLQDGAGRPRHLRRRHPGPAPAHRGRGLHAGRRPQRDDGHRAPSTRARIVGDCQLARP